MGHLLYRFLWVDFGLPVWPNLAASVICLVAAYAVARLHVRRVLEQEASLVAPHHRLLARVFRVCEHLIPEDEP